MSRFSPLVWVHHKPRLDNLNLVLKIVWKSGGSYIPWKDPVIVLIDIWDKALECKIWRNWSLAFLKLDIIELHLVKFVESTTKMLAAGNILYY